MGLLDQHFQINVISTYAGTSGGGAAEALDGLDVGGKGGALRGCEGANAAGCWGCGIDGLARWGAALGRKGPPGRGDEPSFK